MSGIKRNNPGNIRSFVDANGNFSKPFYGEISPPDIKPGKNAGFRIFESESAGYRALFRLLKTGYIDRGYNTIAKIFPRYAPGSDSNDPAGYITNVEKWSGINRNKILESYRDLFPIVESINRMENGIQANKNNVQSGFDSIFNPLLLPKPGNGISIIPPDPGDQKEKPNYTKPILIGAGILGIYLLYKHYAKPKKFNFSR